MCEHERKFDTNFKKLALEDLFYLDEGTKSHVTVKKDSDFMQHSGATTKVCNGIFSEHNLQLMMHANDFFYHFEATVPKNSWNNVNIVESFHK